MPSPTRLPARTYTAIGDKFFKVEVVGDFPKDEAREFFERDLFKAAAQGPVLQDADWEKVYEVRWDSFWSGLSNGRAKGWDGADCVVER